MLLLYGNLMKGTWLFIFAIVSIARGTVRTESSLCQASGFLVHYGTETSDYTVLVISVHSALQVFRPSGSLRSDGLYPFRRYLYVGALLIPTLMSALAFVNPHYGYVSQGAFCSLPLHLYWYRLALAWIPRYVIAILILGLAIAIYTHVGFQLNSFSRAGNSIKSTGSTMSPMLCSGVTKDGTAGNAGINQLKASSRGGSSVLQNMFAPHRASTGSAFPGTTAEFFPPTAGGVRRSQSVPSSSNRRTRHQQHSFSTTTQDSQLPTSPTQNAQTHPLELSSSITAPTSAVQRQLTKERARIHRQLRLMFIYPLVYMLMWIIPFINHCFMYRDKWVAHPVYWLSLLSTICVTLMGAVDCLVFSLREKPWRHIPDSDGGFWGSFVFWRRCEAETRNEKRRGRTGQLRRKTTAETDMAAATATSVLQPALVSGGRGVPRVRRGSGTRGVSDRHKVAAERAIERLEAEIEDRRVANVEGGVRASRRIAMDRLGPCGTDEMSEGGDGSRRDRSNGTVNDGGGGPA
ncbi:G protein-coupled glucose receptor regulating Gpa2-domain-containing protein [Clohesyomyces aquaticus]|uniref:G protein-coupled glucose receptor regulating Gpa2-domain-containing protein n=1 Tax=Clohesyomyces aquaticus TaxID=1231657 RepID=A0A1Y1ZHL8_9PLEO|nr:G protein-coupled glucose receptor regulating Gpa2-domain-containing protein [Clohesyomyces aquaticus]